MTVVSVKMKNYFKTKNNFFKFKHKNIRKNSSIKSLMYIRTIDFLVNI